MFHNSNNQLKQFTYQQKKIKKVSWAIHRPGEKN